MLQHKVNWARSVTAFVLLILSSLTMGSIAIPLALMVVALLTICWNPTWRQLADSERVLRLATLAGIVVACTLIAILGAYLATQNPSIDPLVGSQPGISSPGNKPLGQLSSSLGAGLGAWLIAPLTYLPLVSVEYLSRSVIGFLQHPIFAWLTLLGVGLLICIGALSFFPRAKKMFSIPTSLAQTGLTALPLVSTVALAGMVVMLRPDGLFTVRYMPIWLLPIGVFWVLLASPNQASACKRARILLAAVLTIVGVVTTATLPLSVKRMADLESQRSAFSKLQHDELMDCLPTTAITFTQVIPTVPAAEACRIFRWLQESAIA
jgi:uncharacterized membrane protein